MSRREATCSCGQLRAEVAGEPVRVSVCHCLACQRRSGSVFAAQARFRPEAVRMIGEGKEFVRVGESGARITHTFCPHCGATVWYRIEGDPRVAIPVGAFADPGFPPPQYSVYEERMHAWVRIAGDVEHEH